MNTNTPALATFTTRCKPPWHSSRRLTRTRSNRPTSYRSSKSFSHRRLSGGYRCANPSACYRQRRTDSGVVVKDSVVHRRWSDPEVAAQLAQETSATRRSSVNCCRRHRWKSWATKGSRLSPWLRSSRKLASGWCTDMIKKTINDVKVDIVPYADCAARIARRGLVRRGLARRGLARRGLVQRELARRELVRRELVRRELVRRELARRELVRRGLARRELARADLRDANLRGANLGEGCWCVQGPSRSDGYHSSL